MTKTPGQLEHDAIAVSNRLKFMVFYSKGVKNHEVLYRIFRRTPAGKITLLKETTNPQTLANYFARLESSQTSIPKASTSASFKLPPARANPARRSFKGEDGAARLAERFTGRMPTEGEYRIVEAPSMPESLAAIGKIFAIEYLAERDGKVYRFRHSFKASARPHLAVSPDGQFVTMIGGSWRFTEDGFIDT